MSISTSLAIFFVIWWVVLFAVLPWGIRSQQEAGEVAPGTDPGAPAAHVIWRKLFWTTIVAAVLWIAFYFLHQADIFSFRDIAT